MRFLREWLRQFSNWVASGKDVQKLWVDARRPAPRGWYWATTLEEAVDVLWSRYVQELSFDHRMVGYGDKRLNMVEVIVWYQVNCGVSLWPESKPVSHGKSHVGLVGVEADIKEFGPYKEKKR